MKEEKKKKKGERNTATDHNTHAYILLYKIHGRKSKITIDRRQERNSKIETDEVSNQYYYAIDFYVLNRFTTLLTIWFALQTNKQTNERQRPANFYYPPHRHGKNTHGTVKKKTNVGPDLPQVKD